MTQQKSFHNLPSPHIDVTGFHTEKTFVPAPSVSHIYLFERNNKVIRSYAIRKKAYSYHNFMIRIGLEWFLRKKEIIF